MLQYDPVHRPSISEIFMHPWMQQETPTEVDVQKEFQERHTKVQAAAEAEREERRAARGEKMSTGDEATLRGNELEKEIDTYQNDFTGQTQFFTELSPDVIEKEMQKFLID